MLAMVVQPDGHLRGEAELPENMMDRTQRRYRIRERNKGNALQVSMIEREREMVTDAEFTSFLRCPFLWSLVLSSFDSKGNEGVLFFFTESRLAAQWRKRRSLLRRSSAR